MVSAAVAGILEEVLGTELDQGLDRADHLNHPLLRCHVEGRAQLAPMVRLIGGQSGAAACRSGLTLIGSSGDLPGCRCRSISRAGG